MVDLNDYEFSRKSIESIDTIIIAPYPDCLIFDFGYIDVELGRMKGKGTVIMIDYFVCFCIKIFYTYIFVKPGVSYDPYIALTFVRPLFFICYHAEYEINRMIRGVDIIAAKMSE